MAQIETNKAVFTIKEIGSFRFYGGIFIGIVYAVIFNYLFRLMYLMSHYSSILEEFSTLHVLTIHFPTYYSVLIGFYSIAFSFCYTSYLWMSKPFAGKRRKTMKLRMAQVGPIWILYGTLIFLMEMFWIIAPVEFSIEKNFTVAAFLIPVIVYVYCWNLIFTIYQSKKAVAYASLFLIISGFILSMI